MRYGRSQSRLSLALMAACESTATNCQDFTCRVLIPRRSWRTCFQLSQSFRGGGGSLMSEGNDEEAADADVSLTVLDALADRWAAEVNLTAMIKNAVSPMRLNRNAPDDVRQKFTARMEAQIDAIVRQAFIEAIIRHCQPPPHK